MTQLEFYKSFQFMIELILAEALFLKNLCRREYFILRLIAGLAVIFAVSFFFPLASYGAIYISLMFFVLFAVTLFASWSLFKESFLKILFCCIAGYTVQHLSYELYNLVLNVMGVDVSSFIMYGSQSAVVFPNAFVAIVYFYVYIVIYFFCCFFFGGLICKNEKLQIKSVFIFVLVGVLLAVDIILNAFVVSVIAPDANTVYLIIVGLYNIISCVIALFLQFQVTLRYKLEESLNTIMLIRRKEKEQYAYTKETIELINLKCHDLKHQIRNMGDGLSINEESTRKIENLISIYDSTVRTDNEALDTILTEKRLICNQKGIKLSCIADGKQLDFMEDEDIYSLFGNILDNAVEAVQSLDADKRIISLRVRAVGNIVSVNVNNYYEKKLAFEDGIPQTTKPDKRFHGYGLKSVKYVCDKYGGDFSINTDNHQFVINILFSPDEYTE